MHLVRTMVGGACAIGLTCIACGSDRPTAVEEVARSALREEPGGAVPAIAAELIPLGRINLDESHALEEGRFPIDPPYERQETSQSRYLRDLSLSRAGARGC
jgi:hypothetical protein